MQEGHYRTKQYYISHLKTQARGAIQDKATIYFPFKNTVKGGTAGLNSNIFHFKKHIDLNEKIL